MPVSLYFNSQVAKVQRSIAEMGTRAGKLVGDSIAAFVAKDPVLAREVIEQDTPLDILEDSHEEQIIHLIALNQPVARDLRMLVALLRINSNIERAGDLAGNIAQTTLRIADKPSLRPFVDIPRSYELVRALWDDSIRAVESLDAMAANGLRLRDDEIDQLNQTTIVQLIEIGRDRPDMIYQATNALGVSKSLERIADLAVDIADEIHFITSGELRHHRSQRDTA